MENWSPLVNKKLSQKSEEIGVKIVSSADRMFKN